MAMTDEVERQGVTAMPLRVGDVETPPTLKDEVHLAVDLDAAAVRDARPGLGGAVRAELDRPPSFTSMRRPGIARVVGDRVVLNGTTVEEVAQYHQRTLELAVDATNSQQAEHERREAAAAAARDEAARRHREEVERGPRSGSTTRAGRRGP